MVKALTTVVRATTPAISGASPPICRAITYDAAAPGEAPANSANPCAIRSPPSTPVSQYMPTGRRIIIRNSEKLATMPARRR